MVQTNNVAYARFMYSNSWLLYLATTIADCSTPLAELKLDVAIEPDDEYLTPGHGAKVHSAQNVNRITRYDLVVDLSPGNYRILRIYNDASMKNAKENKCLRSKVSCCSVSHKFQPSRRLLLCILP